MPSLPPPLPPSHLHARTRCSETIHGKKRLNFRWLAVLRFAAVSPPLRLRLSGERGKATRASRTATHRSTRDIGAQRTPSVEAHALPVHRALRQGGSTVPSLPRCKPIPPTERKRACGQSRTVGTAWARRCGTRNCMERECKEEALHRSFVSPLTRARLLLWLLRCTGHPSATSSD
jgi:hypothetical protein